MHNLPLPFFLFLLFSISSSAQYTPHMISAVLDDVQDSAIGDIDGDGDMDLFFDGAFWFEQQNGNLSAVYHPLEFASGKNSALSDVDNDGDLDMIFYDQNNLGYHENLNGLGTSTQKHEVVTLTSAGYKHSSLVDLDGDGDLDFVNQGVRWAENLGNFIFGEEQIIYDVPEHYKATWDMNFVDFDHDGDLDIILNYEVPEDFGRVEILWNQGSNQFSDPEILIDGFDGYDWTFTEVIDVDHDDDFDIVMHKGPKDIVWFRNTGNGFSDEIFIHEYFDFPKNLTVIDGNNDGLVDIFWCGHPGVVWKKNLGDFTFAEEAIVFQPNETNRATNNIEFGDIDLDGDVDIVRMGKKVSNFPQYFRWYENEYPFTFVNAEEPIIQSLDIYPNPVKNWLHIDSEIDTAEIFNANGQLVISSNSSTMDVSNLPTGIYFLKVKLNIGNWSNAKIVKID